MLALICWYLKVWTLLSGAYWHQWNAIANMDTCRPISFIEWHHSDTNSTLLAIDVWRQDHRRSWIIFHWSRSEQKTRATWVQPGCCSRGGAARYLRHVRRRSLARSMQRFWIIYAANAFSVNRTAATLPLLCYTLLPWGVLCASACW